MLQITWAYFVINRMTSNSIILYEHQPCLLDPEDALSLEESCNRVWKDRKTSVLFSDNRYDENPDDPTYQALIGFNRHADGTVWVKPGGYIGIISAGNLQYLILPKIFQEQDIALTARYLDRMFAYAANLKMMESSSVSSGIEACSSLFAELLINAFARRVIILLNRRQYNAYQDVSKNIGTLRGRINFTEHIRRNLAAGRHDRIACSFELYQEDNLLNRIIKHVCRLLLSRTRVFENRRLLTALISLLEDVTDNRVGYRDCLKIRLNAYQQEYVPVLDYCRMFLSFRMANVSSGEYGIDHVLINSSALFENFVTGYLKKQLPSFWKVNPKKTGYIAKEDEEDIFKYENDFILLHKTNGRLIIGDAKYKRIDLNNRKDKYGVSQGDIYQMISYAVCRGAEEVIVVYPGTKETALESRSFHIQDERSERKLQIRICLIPMDVDQELEDQFVPEWVSNII